MNGFGYPPNSPEERLAAAQAKLDMYQSTIDRLKAQVDEAETLYARARAALAEEMRKRPEAYEQGRKDERADIVVWLRQFATEKLHGDLGTSLDEAAERIERGEHVPPKESTRSTKEQP